MSPSPLTPRVDPHDPEAVYRYFEARLADLWSEYRNLRTEVAVEVNRLKQKRRFKARNEYGPGTVRDVLDQLADLLSRIPNETETVQQLRRHVDKNRLPDAIELGAEEGLLIRGVLSTGKAGQPPMVVTLASNTKRPPVGPAPDRFPIRWEDDPEVPPHFRKREPRAPRKPRTPPAHVVSVDPAGKVHVTKNKATTPPPTASQVELTTLKCQHFPDGVGPCQDDCLAVFGSVYPDPYATAEPADEQPADDQATEALLGVPLPPVFPDDGTDPPAETTTPVEEHEYDDDVWLSVGQPAATDEEAAE